MKFRFFDKIIFILSLCTLALQVIGFKLWLESTLFWFLPIIYPLLSAVNVTLFVYWLIRVRWPFLLFVAVFIYSYKSWNLLLQLPEANQKQRPTLSVMSYNVRLFNEYGWLDQIDVPGSMESSIEEVAPDILCLQEYNRNIAPSFEDYPYQYFESNVEGGNHGNAILSKFPISNKGKIEFENSDNGGIYVDIKLENKSLQVYNIHFESLPENFRIVSRQTSLDFRELKNLKEVFKTQELQAQRVDSIVQKSNYPVVICADLNNTVFSKSYKLLADNLKDGFVEAGYGLGSTYWGLVLPLRIDFIFLDRSIEVIEFQTLKHKLSDHKPILTAIKMN